MEPSTYLAYTRGNTFSGMVNTVMLVAMAKTSIVQYHTALMERR